MNDLKQMANLLLTLYRITIQKGISNEVARKFKTNIVQFESYYRVAKALLAMIKETNNVDKTNDRNIANKKKKKK